MALVDLSPDALARLEAQLQADLDAVRRVRALLAATKDAVPVSPTLPTAPAPVESPKPPEIHAPAAPAPENSAPPVAPVAAPVSPVAQLPTQPRTFDVNALIRETIGGMTTQFGIGAVKMALEKHLVSLPADASIRNLMKKMVEEGALRLVRADVGRGGSVYERVLSPELPAVGTDVAGSVPAAS
jgi:hypothetical protein